jgi:hypothetical protein
MASTPSDAREIGGDPRGHLTWFCLVCFAEIDSEHDRCPRCDADLRALDAEQFDRRLIRVLRHRLADHRLLAARILGRRRTLDAVRSLADVAEHDADPFVAAEAVRALARLGNPEALAAVHRVAARGSVIPRRAAHVALGSPSARGSGDR